MNLSLLKWPCSTLEGILHFCEDYSTASAYSARFSPVSKFNMAQSTSSREPAVNRVFLSAPGRPMLSQCIRGWSGRMCKVPQMSLSASHPFSGVSSKTELSFCVYPRCGPSLVVCRKCMYTRPCKYDSICWRNQGCHHSS